MRSRKPTPSEIAAARGKTVRDVIAPGLKLLFCGINPSLYSAAVGHHFARPGNRFWPALHRGGFTARLLSPFEDDALLALGYGITNVVDRATASADELSATDFVAGAQRLLRKVRRYRPRWLAFLGVTAYRTAFAEPLAILGPQPKVTAKARVWVLPNPSGLNAHFQVNELGRLFKELRVAVESGSCRDR